MSAVAEDETAKRAPRPWRAMIARGAGRFLFATLAGLILGGIVHIVAILLIPAMAGRNAGNVYLALGAGGHAELIATADTTLPGLREADPAAVIAICGYDLTAGPVRVVARTGTLPLGLTVHRRGGGVVYAITDRAAIRGVVEFLVMTEEQRDERIAKDEDGEASRELRIVSDATQGLIVARAIAKRPSDASDARSLATGVACGLAD